MISGAIEVTSLSKICLILKMKLDDDPNVPNVLLFGDHTGYLQVTVRKANLMVEFYGDLPQWYANF